MSIADQLLAEGRQEGLSEGLQQGLSQGRQEGLLFGRIQALQELLGVPMSDQAALSTKSEEELRTLAKELQVRLAKAQNI